MKSSSSRKRRRVREEDGDAERKGTLRWSLQGGESTNRRGDGGLSSSPRDVGGDLCVFPSAGVCVCVCLDAS